MDHGNAAGAGARARVGQEEMWSQTLQCACVPQNQKGLVSAWAGNRTRASRVAGENSTTEPPMPWTTPFPTTAVTARARRRRSHHRRAPSSCPGRKVLGPGSIHPAGERQGHGDQSPGSTLTVSSRGEPRLSRPDARAPSQARRCGRASGPAAGRVSVRAPSVCQVCVGNGHPRRAEASTTPPDSRGAVGVSRTSLEGTEWARKSWWTRGLGDQGGRSRAWVDEGSPKGSRTRRAGGLCRLPACSGPAASFPHPPGLKAEQDDHQAPHQNPPPVVAGGC